MPKSATELMQDILFSAFLDGVEALKAGSGGLPNQLLRDLNGIHRNVTMADLPQSVQDALAANVRAAFTRMLKEGYAVTPSSGVRTPSPSAIPPRGGRPAGDRPGRPGGPRPSGPRPPRPPRGKPGPRNG